MNLLGELLFSRDHPDPRLRDACEAQPIRTLDRFEGLNYNIADSGVQMESGEDSRVHTRFDRITRATIRSGGQVNDGRSNRVLEPVIKGHVGCRL